MRYHKLTEQSPEEPGRDEAEPLDIIGTDATGGAGSEIDRRQREETFTGRPCAALVALVGMRR